MDSSIFSFHGWRSLVGCSPWGREESDTTERLHFDFSLSCIGEGNGNPLQCSCLEDPRDGGACGLPSMGSHRVGHDWSDLAAAAPNTVLGSNILNNYFLIKREVCVLEFGISGWEMCTLLCRAEHWKFLISYMIISWKEWGEKACKTDWRKGKRSDRYFSKRKTD